MMKNMMIIILNLNKIKRIKKKIFNSKIFKMYNIQKKMKIELKNMKIFRKNKIYMNYNPKKKIYINNHQLNNKKVHFFKNNIQKFLTSLMDFKNLNKKLNN